MPDAFPLFLAIALGIACGAALIPLARRLVRAVSAATSAVAQSTWKWILRHRWATLVLLTGATAALPTYDAITEALDSRRRRQEWAAETAAAVDASRVARSHDSTWYTPDSAKACSDSGLMIAEAYSDSGILALMRRVPDEIRDSVSDRSYAYWKTRSCNAFQEGRALPRGPDTPRNVQTPAAVSVPAAQVTPTAVAIVGCIERADQECVLAALRSGASPNGTLMGDPLLYHAARKGDTAIVRALVRAGAAIDAKTAISERTALHEAALQGRTEVVSVLLELGADVNATNRFGRTPLQYATTPPAPLQPPANGTAIAALLRHHGGR